MQGRILVVDDERAMLVALKGLLAKEGYDPAYGARPLKRVIQKRLQDPLARMILEGKLADGETVKVSAVGGELTLNGHAATPTKRPAGATVN